MPSKSSKPFVFPKVKPSPVIPPPVMTPQQSLKQFATKPVVKPLGKSAIKQIIKPLKSYLP
jgi:hypothetical protein